MLVVGTGTRTLKGADWNAMRSTLSERITQAGVTHVLSGGARGYDHCLASAAKRAGVGFTLVLPSPDFGAYYWWKQAGYDEALLARWAEMTQYADDIVHINETPMGSNGRYGGSNYDRNIAMLAMGAEEAGSQLWVYNPRKAGGTQHCVNANRDGGFNLEVVEL